MRVPNSNVVGYKLVGICTSPCLGGCGASLAFLSLAVKHLKPTFIRVVLFPAKNKGKKGSIGKRV